MTATAAEALRLPATPAQMLYYLLQCPDMAALAGPHGMLAIDIPADFRGELAARYEELLRSQAVRAAPGVRVRVVVTDVFAAGHPGTVR